MDYDAGQIWRGWVNLSADLRYECTLHLADLGGKICQPNYTPGGNCYTPMSQQGSVPSNVTISCTWTVDICLKMVDFSKEILYNINQFNN